MIGTSSTQRHRPSEEGYLLVAVIFMLALVILSLAVALPKVREDIQRDRDVETMHRGKQFVRAIQLYYRKFGRYPPNIDALVKTNDIRFLRKRYIDPTTGKDDWKPVLFGQNKVPKAYGFFGQPLGGSTVAGTGPGGLNGLNGSGSNAGNGLGTSSNSGSSGSAFGGGSSFGGSSFSLGSNSPSGSSAFGTSPTSGTNSPGSANGSNSGNGTDAGSGSSTGTGPTGQTFGGAGIIGFSPASPKQSVVVFKKKNHYNEWEFTYDPLTEQQMMSGGNTGMIGQPAGGTSNNPFGGTSGNGTQTGGNGFGNNFGGTTPTPAPPAPATPQQ